MSTTSVFLLCVSCLCYLFGLAVPSHFRGGTIQWRPVNSREFDGNIEITHRVAWRASRHQFYCDQTTISSQALLPGEGNLVCQSGCSETVGNMSFYCTDFSTSEDWTTGGRTYTYNATGITSFEASFSSCCWISTLISGADGSWELRVKGTLTARNDTGSVNHSPISSTSPIVRLQYGYSHTIQIPVEDADGDEVRCRWAESSKGECAGVCRAINATLFGCNIQFTANETIGLYAVALQIEDFASRTATVPLSSIPLQFIIEVFCSTTPCGSYQPEIVGGTRCIEVSSTYRERIVAQSGGSNIRIVDIITVSPVGLLKSNLNASTTPHQWFVDVTWTPTFSQSGQNIFCYYALNSIGLTSPQTCITLSVVQAPQLVRSSISPTGLVNPSEIQWSMEFDKQFRRPTSSRFIRIYDVSTNTEVITIDVSTSSTVTYPTTNSETTLFFRTNYTFTYGASYYVLLDPGVALGTEHCGPESAAIHDPTFWTFTVVGGVVLRSEVNRPSIDFNELCLKDRLVYTCTTSSGLKWTVGTTSIGAYISSQGTTVVGATRTVASLPGVVANLTKMDDTLLTSTLTISSTETIVNELEIVCEGSSGIRKSLIFHQKFQKLIGLSGRNQTTANSINITITFNLSITNNVDIRGTATPVDDNSYSIVVTMLGPITKPELKVPFSALQAGTTYTFEIEAISRDNPTSCIGVGISGLLLQTDSADDLLRVQNIIGLSGRNQITTNSINITITFNLSITNNVDIRGTATPVDDSSYSIVVTIPGPITTPELKVPFSGLQAGTTYTFAIEAISRDNPTSCIGVGISGLLLQTDTADDLLHDPIMTNSLSAGAVVGTSITIFLVSFFAGALLAALIIGGYTRWRGKRQFSCSEGPQPAPGLAGPSKAVEMENIYEPN